MTDAPQVWPKQSAAAMNAYYGDPDANHDGAPDRTWQQRDLVQITPPYAMFYDGNPVSRITVHKLAADSLMRVLTRIAERFDAQSRRLYGLDQFGGIFNFRRKRGGSKSLSVHSWAAAIDLAVARNPFGAPYGSRIDMMPIEVVGFFEDEGWDWGGLWSNHDAMHFQAAKTGQQRTTVPLGGGRYRWAAEPVPRPASERPGSASELPSLWEVPANSKSRSASEIPNNSCNSSNNSNGSRRWPVKGDSSPEVGRVQQQLRALGYTEVGNVDGIFGDMTEAAILIFQRDNGLPKTGAIDNMLIVELGRAAPRQMAGSREDAPPKVVREKVPEVAGNWWSKVVAFWGMIVSAALGLGEFAMSNLLGARALVEQIAAVFGAIPMPVYVVLVIAGLGFLWLKARQGEQAGVDAYQRGARR